MKILVIEDEKLLADSIKSLLQAGADVTIEDNKNRRAASYATTEEITQMLHEAGSRLCRLRRRRRYPRFL